MIRDAIGVIGFVAMTYGVWSGFGFDWACIIGGATLLTLAVLGATRK